MPTQLYSRTCTPLVALLCCLFMSSSISLAEDKPSGLQDAKHQVTGLCCAERVDDLRKAAKQLTDIELLGVDYDTAEAVFQYNPALVFPNMTPEKTVERFDELLRSVSRHTFGIKPLCTTPRDQLQLIEISVVGLDCKACSFAAYESIYKLDGVEQATASFKTGLVSAWIHPTKTDGEKLKETLVNRGVTLKLAQE